MKNILVLMTLFTVYCQSFNLATDRAVIQEIRTLNNLTLPAHPTVVESFINDSVGVRITSITYTPIDVYNMIKITKLPESIGNLEYLQNINLANNLLTNIPDTVRNLKHLTMVSLSSNKLDSLPDFNFSTIYVKNFIVNNNNLKKLPSGIGLMRIREWGMDTLNVNNNQLDSLPNSICNLNGIVNIRCSYNKIRHIPDSIGKIRTLKMFYGDHNLIDNIPVSFMDSGIMESIYLMQNEIQYLDPIFVNLTKLLGINYNHLCSIPDDIRTKFPSYCNMRYQDTSNCRTTIEETLPVKVIYPTITTIINPNMLYGKVSLYSINGTLITKGTNIRIKVSNGAYVAKINNNTVKVYINK